MRGMGPMGRKPIFVVTGLVIGLTLSGCHWNDTNRSLQTRGGTAGAGAIGMRNGATTGWGRRDPAGMSINNMSATGQQNPAGSFQSGGLQSTNQYYNPGMSASGQSVHTRLTTPSMGQQPVNFPSGTTGTSTPTYGNTGLQQTGGIQPAQNTLNTQPAGFGQYPSRQGVPTTPGALQLPQQQQNSVIGSTNSPSDYQNSPASSLNPGYGSQQSPGLPTPPSGTGTTTLPSYPQ